MNSDFKWTMEKPENNIIFPNLTINLETKDYNRWFFKFKAVTTIEEIYDFYYEILSFPLAETDKFSLVLNNKDMFNIITKKPLLNLKVNLFVMLVDLEKEEIIKEVQISQY